MFLNLFSLHLYSKEDKKGVDSLLCRLYTPILWRAMKVANSHIRRQVGVYIRMQPCRDGGTD